MVNTTATINRTSTCAVSRLLSILYLCEKTVMPTLLIGHVSKTKTLVMLYEFSNAECNTNTVVHMVSRKILAVYNVPP